jgi:hypothetical protein
MTWPWSPWAWVLLGVTSGVIGVIWWLLWRRPR